MICKKNVGFVWSKSCIPSWPIGPVRHRIQASLDRVIIGFGAVHAPNNYLNKLEIVRRWSTKMPPLRPQKLEWPVWPWPIDPLTHWPGNGTRQIVSMECVCATYEYNPRNRQRATERTRFVGRTDRRTDGRGETNIPLPPSPSVTLNPQPLLPHTTTSLCGVYNDDNWTA